MKVGAVVCLLVGGLLGALAVAFLFIPGTSNGFAWTGLLIGSIALGIAALACLVVGVVLLVRGGRILGQDPLLATGQPATAIIRAVRDTGITLQFGAFAVLKFDLEVGYGMPSPYLVSCRSTVPRIALSMVGVGKTVAVMIDPRDRNHVAINWSSAPPQESSPVVSDQAGAGAASVGGSGNVAIASETFSSADILARGVSGSATLLGTYPASLPPVVPDHTLIGLMLNVMVHGRPPFQVQTIYNAPDGKLGSLTPGALLPVRVDPDNADHVAVDWDSL